VYVSSQAAPDPCGSYCSAARTLAHADRPKQALKWLQDQVPVQILTSNMVKAVVTPLLSNGRVQEAQQAVDWACDKFQATTLTVADDAEAAGSSGRTDDAAGVAAAAQQLLCDSHQSSCPALRLKVAAAHGDLKRVHEEWAAITAQEQQHELQRQQQQQGRD